MTIAYERNGDALEVIVVGQLVVTNRMDLKQRVLEELDRGARRVRIDFAETGYIDSSGLGVLVSLAKKIREAGGDLRIANLNAGLKTLFELTKLDTLFRIDYDDDRDGSAPHGAPLRPRAPDPLRGAAEADRPE